ncbi:MAG: type IV toxin-antitoxin system AbiEi family antitoxin domain-containing protein [Chitinivibrionales bacterium]|nr:type IV toxin-antitoxin system AbiEi family antitoxin domain-containing protein [Chitinivibrionales bacterium]
MKTAREQILDFARQRSVFRAGEIPNISAPRMELSRMVAQGELIRVDRGLYSLPETEVTENHSIVEAVKLYRGGVVCLISALYFHKIGTQLPYETWIMRQDKNIVPTKGIPVRFVYCTGGAYSYGIEMHRIEGVDVNIYTPTKTVADCFKYRNKIGLDVAIEALQEGWKAKMFTMDELWAAVKVCRVQNVIQPYMEMLVQ